MTRQISWKNWIFRKTPREEYVLKDKTLRLHHDHYIFYKYLKTFREDADATEWERILLAVDGIVGPWNLILLPYYCILHGGVNFMIPYAIVYFFVAIPLYFLEFLLAKITKLGPERVLSFLNPTYRGMTVAIYVVGLLQTIVFGTYGVKFLELAKIQLDKSQNVELDLVSHTWINGLLEEGCDDNEIFGCFPIKNYADCRRNPIQEICDPFWASENDRYYQVSHGFTPTFQYNLENSSILNPHQFTADVEPFPTTHFVFWALVTLLSLETASYVAKFSLVLKICGITMLAVCAHTAYKNHGGREGLKFFYQAEVQRIFENTLWPNAVGLAFMSLSCCNGFLHKIGSISKRRSRTALKTLAVVIIADWSVKSIVITLFYCSVGVVAVTLHPDWSPANAINDYLRQGGVLSITAFPEYKLISEKFLQFDRTNLMFYFLVLVLFCARTCSLYLLELESLIQNGATVRLICGGIASSISRFGLITICGIFLALISVGFAFPTTFLAIMPIQDGLVASVVVVATGELLVIGFAYSVKKFLDTFLVRDIDFYTLPASTPVHWFLSIQATVFIPSVLLSTVVSQATDFSDLVYGDFRFPASLKVIEYVIPFIVLIAICPLTFLLCTKKELNMETLFSVSKEWKERARIVSNDHKNVEKLDYAELFLHHVAGSPTQTTTKTEGDSTEGTKLSDEKAETVEKESVAPKLTVNSTVNENKTTLTVAKSSDTK
ncbi:unnamed protein product [Bursaphelenchus xylophilus]|uniref:(pine wood nematode) hypothetical protein n=1 Tax=Bursaphelenchus xylophilus TaxID=6326 RepID=A0A1I7SFU8_BURXY|nr:unnamed protein product [Bursaphelenchus xylophilus]CAG9080971.1 unnamed protein product [Bursaphelenchus xylophilus]